MVSPPRGLTGQNSGSYQTEQPVLDEKGIRPAMEVPSLSHATTFAAFPKNRTQTLTHPLASFHSLNESRQHANGPCTRFGASPKGMRRFGLLSRRHCRRGVFRAFGHSSSIFLEPFARPALPGFVATMAPLTPARHRLVSYRSLCVMCSAFRSFRLQPPGAPRHRFDTLPFSVTGFRFRSGLRQLAAGSPKHPAESSSLMLRTDHSPCGTLHPASRRRSSVRLQAGERLLG